jgi:hypothetical protein
MPDANTRNLRLGSGVKLRFLQSIALAGLLGCCSGSRETAVAAADFDGSSKSDEPIVQPPVSVKKAVSIRLHG